MYKNMSPWYSANNVKTITLLCSSAMNNDTPMAVDILFVYDDIVGAQLLTQTAKQWFAAKAEYQLKYGADIDAVSMELVPSLSYENVSLPVNARLAVKVILFADYMMTSGQYPLDLSNWQNPVVTFGQKEIQYSEAK